MKSIAKFYRERQEFESPRRDMQGIINYMARADGYVMVRRKGAMPFVIREKDWRTMPIAEDSR